MSNFDIVIEFAKFWEAFDVKDLDITNSRKGVKSKCLVTYKKYVKDQTKADKLLFSLIEQKKHYRKCVSMGIEKPGYFPGVNPWLNGAKWEQELDDVEDLKRLQGKSDDNMYVERELEKCCIPDCKKQVHGPKFDKCSKHITVTDEFKKEVVDGLAKRGLMKRKSESRSEWINRLKEHTDINSARPNAILWRLA